MRNHVIVLLLVAVTVPWAARPAAAIAYGENARDGAYPFSVLLTMTGLPDGAGGTRDSSCSGALIAARWVITAGHCFRDGDGRRVNRVVARRTVATVGRADLDSRDGHQTEVVAVHQAGHTDVALAELAEPITGVTPIPVATDPPRVGEVLRLTGFGLTVGDGAIGPTDRMQTGQFTVDAVGDTLIEASGLAPRSDTSPCPHDSGGPYFRELPDGSAVLAAVVSSGPGCPHPGPDLSARTDNLGDWIAGVTESRAGAGSLGGLAWTGIAALLLAALFLTGIAVRRFFG
ncbi:trypsin-like serine protease [Actinoplanes sp. NPDC024001]|uniref:S1 family peptidase n=1 Tax=Actinoplanes sp. NPDC024001 TaxID=3154598 RepID=UPI0033C0D69C